MPETPKIVTPLAKPSTAQSQSNYSKQGLPDLASRIKQMDMKNPVGMTDAEWDLIVKRNATQFNNEKQL